MILSHLAGLFEYLFMFWLHRHLWAKQALNSTLTAKWLGFISRSQIRMDHIFNSQKMTLCAYFSVKQQQMDHWIMHKIGTAALTMFRPLDNVNAFNILSCIMPISTLLI